MKIEGSGSASGSICQRHGSADQDQDPHKKVMDPQHFFKGLCNEMNNILEGPNSQISNLCICADGL
jgi:hypothetical protein